MWTLVAQAVFSMVLSYAITAMTAPKPQRPTAGSLDVPEPQPGSLIGVSFGTNVFKGTHVAWYGDAQTRPIRSSSGK